MEIKFFDRDMRFLGVMENQKSLIWTRKYFEPGNFEIHAPATEYNRRLTEKRNLVWLYGHREAGIIEDREINEGADENEIIVKGRFLSAYMDRRLIRQTIRYSGTVENAMHYLLSIVENIPAVELGETNGFREQVSFQVTYKNLLSYMEQLGRASGLGFRFRPDFNARKIYFEVYSGTDRSQSQRENSRVTFSENYDNLNNVTFRENDQLYKNVAYVGGEGEGEARVYVKVGEASGLDLREMFVDARDLRSDGLTQEEYMDLLTQRGMEALAEAKEASSFECETEADVNYIYRRDYDLGDIVTVQKRSWGINADFRITEICEVYENEIMRVIPVFGSPLPEK